MMCIYKFRKDILPLLATNQESESSEKLTRALRSRDIQFSGFSKGLAAMLWVGFCHSRLRFSVAAVTSRGFEEDSRSSFLCSSCVIATLQCRMAIRHFPHIRSLPKCRSHDMESEFKNPLLLPTCSEHLSSLTQGCSGSRLAVVLPCLLAHRHY